MWANTFTIVYRKGVCTLVLSLIAYLSNGNNNTEVPIRLKTELETITLHRHVSFYLFYFFPTLFFASTATLIVILIKLLTLVIALALKFFPADEWWRKSLENIHLNAREKKSKHNHKVTERKKNATILLRCLRFSLQY